METFQSAFKILVIEDNLLDYELVKLYLQEHFTNLVLKHAKCFKEAKAILTTNKNSFDVVLLDLSLPDKTGFKLINEILVVCLNTPILVLTGYEDLTFGVKSLAKGVSDYLIKDDLTPILLYKSILYSLERKKAVTAIQESEQQYSELFHLSPQPMWVYDPKNNQFLDANNAAVRQYGYSKEEFLSMTSSQIKLKLNVYSTCNILESNKIRPNGICIHQKKNSENIKVDIHSNSIEYKGIAAFIVLANDASSRLDYIKAIEVQNKKLKEISWIQSHMVRAPVARILGLCTLITDGNITDKNQIIAYIHHSATELDNVIKDINKKINKKEKQRFTTNL
jgi:PAS domain S-box-containing protein